MWAIVTDADELITEKQCLWPELRPDVRIRELRYRDSRGQVGKIHGFELYGFQRYSLSPMNGGVGVRHAGTQLIGVSGDQVTVVDINEITGQRTQKKMSRAELTYNQELLRHGVEG